MKIIAFGHRKKVGKDTATNLLIDRLSYLRVERHGFADKLKDIAYDLYKWAGMSTRGYYEARPDAKIDFLRPLGLSVRQVWIELGNQIRKVYEDTWIDYVLNIKDIDLLIVPDLRYPNEAAKLRAKGAYLVKIIKPDVPDTHDVADDALADYTEWDQVVINNGSLSELDQKIYTAVKGYINAN